ncbi:hypothetical protein EIP86_002381 [Pleurotus ostreatoroseus]|nr:hypothetical protein EIP86_002381 [Pleurotus ostreatoroseus]
MHRAWQIDEVSNRIVSHVKTYDARGVRPDPTSLAALAALARTCRVVSSPALDQLWADLHSLLPILRCLPPELWSVKSASGGLAKTKQFTLKKQPSASDWQLLRKHAHRVRSLTLQYWDQCWNVNDWTRCHCFGGLEVLNANVAHWYNGSPLFPQLVSLHYTLQTPMDTPFGTKLPECLLKLAGPQLRQLNLAPMSLLGMNGQVSTLPAEMPGFVTVSTAVDVISRDYPHLTSLLLGFLSEDMISGYTSPATLRLSTAIDNTIPRLSELQLIRTTVPLPKDWRASLSRYGSLHNLRNLTIMMPLQTSAGTDSQMSPTAFRSLTSLNLQVVHGGAKVATKVLQAFKAPALRSINVVLTAFGSDVIMNQLMAAAAAFPSLDSISLALEADGELGDNLLSVERQAVISGEAFTPILQVKGLRRLKLEGRVGCGFNDAFIEKLAKAWPHLQTLSVKLPNCQEVPLVTAAAVLSLVTHCRQLCTLCLAVDATTPPSDDMIATAEALPRSNDSRIFELPDFGSQTVDPRAWAQFLHALQFNLGATGPMVHSVLSNGWEFVEGQMYSITGERIKIVDDDTLDDLD